MTVLNLGVAALLAMQITPMRPMPKGTALPPEGTEEAAVMAPINATFAALAARNGSAMLPHLMTDGTAVVADERPDGRRVVRRISFAQFAGGVKPGAETFEERFYDPAIEIDGDIAMVWGRYDFRINGKVDHCGYNHFSMVRDAGQWKIANLSWSQRTTGCTG